MPFHFNLQKVSHKVNEAEDDTNVTFQSNLFSYFAVLQQREVHDMQILRIPRLLGGSLLIDAIFGRNHVNTVNMLDGERDEEPCFPPESSSALALIVACFNLYLNCVHACSTVLLHVVTGLL